MAAELYEIATEYVALEITEFRGSVADITSVGVAFLPPNTNPTSLAEFTMVLLVDGTSTEPDPLSEAGKVDILARIGTKAAADIALTPGDYQVFTLIQTATEDIVRVADTVTIL